VSEPQSKSELRRRQLQGDPSVREPLNLRDVETRLSWWKNVADYNNAGRVKSTCDDVDALLAALREHRAALRPLAAIGEHPLTSYERSGAQHGSDEDRLFVPRHALRKLAVVLAGVRDD